MKYTRFVLIFWLLACQWMSVAQVTTNDTVLLRKAKPNGTYALEKAGLDEFRIGLDLDGLRTKNGTNVLSGKTFADDLITKGPTVDVRAAINGIGGAIPNDGIDDLRAITNALQYASTRMAAVVFPPGEFTISGTITLPAETVGSDKRMHVVIIGTAAHSGSKSVVANAGTVIRTTGNFTAIQTPVTEPNVLQNWVSNIDIRNITVIGPQFMASPVSSSFGLDLNGVLYAHVNNFHAEGFGCGLRTQNGAAIFLSGITEVQNNYYGWCSRTNDTDMQVWVETLIDDNNQIPVVFDNPRSVWVGNAEMIVNAHAIRTNALSRVYLTNCSNTQIYWDNLSSENDDPIPLITTDTNGFGSFVINKGNFESSMAPIFEAKGYFDNLIIRNSHFDRGVWAVTGTNAMPVIVLSSNAPAGDDNLRANMVTLEDNSPDSANYAVRNEFPQHDPFTDDVPPFAEQVNPVPAMDRIDDNSDTEVVATKTLFNTIYGSWELTTNNVQYGRYRVFWSYYDPDNSAAIIYPTTPIKGVDNFHVVLTCFDDGGTYLPRVYFLDGFTPDEWNMYYRVKLGQFQVGTNTFTKYLLSVTVKNKAKAASIGIKDIGVAGFFGGQARSDTGLESLKIYVDRRRLRNSDVVPRWDWIAASNLLSNPVVFQTGATNAAAFSTPITSISTNTDVITLQSAAPPDGRLVSIRGTTNLPSPIKANKVYYVVSSSESNIQLSATYGGPAIHFDFTNDVGGLTLCEGKDNTVMTLTGGRGYVEGNGPRLVFGHANIRNGEKLGAIESVFSFTDDGNYGMMKFLTRASDLIGLTNRMTLDEKGNLGLGVPAGGEIASRLHVTGKGTDVGYFRSIDQNTNVLTLASASDYVAGHGPRLSLRNDNNNTGQELGYIKGAFHLDDNGDYGDVVIGTRYEGTVEDKFWFKTHGRLGIGTNTPLYTLDVIGDARATGAYWFGDGTSQTTSFIPGIDATVDLINKGGGTNRLVFVGGILRSNLSGYFP